MIETAHDTAYSRRTAALRAAILRSVAYADVFDYPLSASELHRYLHGERATLDEVRAVLEEGVPGVDCHAGLYVLAGRLWAVAERRRRAAFSRPPVARIGIYAHVLRYLPFVRMVGLTGSLAMHNTDGRGDIDLLVITVPGRVWLGRAMVIALVRVARLFGDLLCPNYVAAESALALDDSSIYAAHELAQMVPLFGGDVYQRLWASNAQIVAHLPNAQAWPMRERRPRPMARGLQQIVEHLLGGALGDRLEAWERRRKLDQLRLQETNPSAEIVLSPDQCKGHFDRHRARVLDAYGERLSRGVDGLPRSLRPDGVERRSVPR